MDGGVACSSLAWAGGVACTFRAVRWRFSCSAGVRAVSLCSCRSGQEREMLHLRKEGYVINVRADEAFFGWIKSGKEAPPR